MHFDGKIKLDPSLSLLKINCIATGWQLCIFIDNMSTWIIVFIVGNCCRCISHTVVSSQEKIDFSIKPTTVAKCKLC